VDRTGEGSGYELSAVSFPEFREAPKLSQNPRPPRRQGIGPAAEVKFENRIRGKSRRYNSFLHSCLSHACLKGLAHVEKVDKNCPDWNSHGKKHVDKLSFLSLVRDQPARDRGHDADCAPMFRSGARGSLFKVHLTSHG
jgi:hypothetical protein